MGGRRKMFVTFCCRAVGTWLAQGSHWDLWGRRNEFLVGPRLHQGQGSESMARALGSISLPPCGCNCSFRQRSKRCEGRERRSNLRGAGGRGGIPFKILTEGKTECVQGGSEESLFWKKKKKASGNAKGQPSFILKNRLPKWDLPITGPRAAAGPRDPLHTAPPHLLLCGDPQAAVEGGKT